MNDAAVRGGAAGPYGPDEGGQRNGHPKHPSAHTHCAAAVCESEDLLSQLGGVASLAEVD